MKALIVFDTDYGMTEKIAVKILSGMKDGGVSDVVMKKADVSTEEDFKAADAWVFGSPVHIGGATGTTKKALKMALKTGTNGKRGTAFDTRFANTKGKAAAEKMAEAMKEEGVAIVVEPMWFVVMKTKGPLAEGEEDKAAVFGKTIAQALSK